MEIFFGHFVYNMIKYNCTNYHVKSIFLSGFMQGGGGTMWSMDPLFMLPRTVNWNAIIIALFTMTKLYFLMSKYIGIIQWETICQYFLCVGFCKTNKRAFYEFDGFAMYIIETESGKRKFFFSSRSSWFSNGKDERRIDTKYAFIIIRPIISNQKVSAWRKYEMVDLFGWKFKLNRV